MLLMNGEINLIQIWSMDCVISPRTRETKFATIDTKLYFPVVTLSTQDKTKLLQELRSGFKHTITGINTNQK